MKQRWRQLGFLHWPVEPALIAALLPPGLEVDTWQGRAYVGMVPFTIRASRPSFLPPLPGLSSFNELNLRTYVHRDGRDPGVWFFSLDASSRLAVWGARAVYRLPYYYASIAMTRSRRGVISFSSRRATSRGRPMFACSYEPLGALGEAALGTLEFFLLERYLLYSADGPRLRSARVAHRPYRFAPARVFDLEEDLALSAGVQVPYEDPITHYADDVDVKIYPPAAVKQRVRDRLAPGVVAQPQIQEVAGV